MANYAVVNEEDGMCVNVVVWDGVAPWAPPLGTFVVELAADSHAGIGWHYDAASQIWDDVRPATIDVET